MDFEKPKVQKVVIDMSHAWTPEEKQKKQDKEKSGKKRDSQEQKEYPRRFEIVRQYLEKQVAIRTGDEDSKNYYQERLADLYCGNEGVVMELLEDSCPHNIDGKLVEKEELDEWRKAVFEISKGLSIGKSFNSDEIGTFLNEAFEEKKREMDLRLENNPTGYNAEDIKKWDKDISRWQDISNDMFFNKGSENALLLIEKEIDDLTEFIQGWRNALLEVSKAKDRNFDDINKYKRFIDEDVKKIARFRRMRNSLYEVKFKSGI